MLAHSYHHIADRYVRSVKMLEQCLGKWTMLAFAVVCDIVWRGGKRDKTSRSCAHLCEARSNGISCAFRIRDASHERAPKWIIAAGIEKDETRFGAPCHNFENLIERKCTPAEVHLLPDLSVDRDQIIQTFSL